MPIWLGTDVLLHEDRRPILYDHQGQPMARQVGFQPKENVMPKKQGKSKGSMSMPSGLDIGKARIAVGDQMKGFKKPGKGAQKIK